MKKKGQISPKTAKAMKQLDQIPDKRLKVFFKILLLAKDCGINVFEKTSEEEAKRREPPSKKLDRLAGELGTTIKGMTAKEKQQYARKGSAK